MSAQQRRSNRGATGGTPSGLMSQVGPTPTRSPPCAAALRPMRGLRRAHFPHDGPILRWAAADAELPVLLSHPPPPPPFARTGPEDAGGSQRRAVHQAAGHDGAAPKVSPPSSPGLYTHTAGPWRHHASYHSAAFATPLPIPRNDHCFGNTLWRFPLVHSLRIISCWVCDCEGRKEGGDVNYAHTHSLSVKTVCRMLRVAMACGMLRHERGRPPPPPQRTAPLRVALCPRCADTERAALAGPTPAPRPTRTAARRSW